METTSLVAQSLATDAEWSLAAHRKRDADYATLVGGVGDWTEPEIDALYQERWGGEAEFQLSRLREDAKDGELMGFFDGNELAAFATLRETNLLADEGPRLLIVAQMYILQPKFAPEVAKVIAAIADARAIEETDLTIPAEHAEAFAAAGFGAKIVTMRRRWQF